MKKTIVPFSLLFELATGVCHHPNFRLLLPGFHEPPISQVEAVLISSYALENESGISEALYSP